MRRVVYTHAVAHGHRVHALLEVCAVRMACLPISPSHVSSTVFAVPARSPRHFVPVCTFLAELFQIRKRGSSAHPQERRGVWLPGRSDALPRMLQILQIVTDRLSLQPGKLTRSHADAEADFAAGQLFLRGMRKTCVRTSFIGRLCRFCATGFGPGVRVLRPARSWGGNSDV